jgi:glycosyltransferase involved in cell wall biosynthesis
MSIPRLRIGFVTSSWGARPGGVETVLDQLTASLTRRGHTICALALSTDREVPEGVEVDEVTGGISLRRIGWRYESQRELADLVRNPPLEEVAARWVADLGLDLIHIHHLSGWGLGIPPRLAELSVPVLWTLHDYWSICPRGQLFSRDGEVCSAVEPERCGRCWSETWPQLGCSGTPGRQVAARLEAAREAFAACEQLLVPSAAAREVFGERGVDISSIEVCENGIERITAERVAPPEDEETIRVGFLGSVQPSKGVLEIARLLEELGDPFTLEVHGPRDSYHGDRSCIEALEDLAETSERIELRGPYRRGDLPRILSRLQLVVVPSLWPETFGLVAREARAVGVSVFASRTGGLDDPAFHLLSPGDLEAWRNALDRFARQRSWREELVERTFAPRGSQSMCDELERRYLDLVL